MAQQAELLVATVQRASHGSQANCPRCPRDAHHRRGGPRADAPPHLAHLHGPARRCGARRSQDLHLSAAVLRGGTAAAGRRCGGQDGARGTPTGRISWRCGARLARPRGGPWRKTPVGACGGGSGSRSRMVHAMGRVRPDTLRGGRMTLGCAPAMRGLFEGTAPTSRTVTPAPADRRNRLHRPPRQEVAAQATNGGRGRPSDQHGRDRQGRR